MEKKIAGLLGAVAAIGTLSTAQASPAPTPMDPLQANSYADLLAPIPNAAATLRAADAQAPANTVGEKTVGEVQVAYHHHHHHHHGYFRHHPVIVVRPHRHYHHHHHHHHHY